MNPDWGLREEPESWLEMECQGSVTGIYNKILGNRYSSGEARTCLFYSEAFESFSKAHDGPLLTEIVSAGLSHGASREKSTKLQPKGVAPLDSTVKGYGIAWANRSFLGSVD